MELKSQKAKFKGFALIRDKDGQPKIDDYKNCPDEIKAMLTEDEKRVLENVTNT